MSYRGLKRVLGETNLERKCRWWFGIMLGVLLFLSFYWSGRYLQQIVREQDQKLGPELVRAAWMESHFQFDLKFYTDPDDSGSDSSATSDEEFASEIYQELMENNRDLGRKFEWYAILPQNPEFNPKGLNAPEHDYEWEYLNRYVAPSDPPFDPGFAEKRIEIDGKEVYRYYKPLYADRNCVVCHKTLGRLQRGSFLNEGDLLALMRVEVNQKDTRDDIAMYIALMITVAVIIFVLSMFLLWFIIRYVIVKPVQHLRDVANAIREGDTTQRAEIRTGDEFEELAGSFNRMLRQLLHQQETLQDVNGKLDGKVDQLAQLNLQLFEMNRLKSDFLATMSHELRTPLNSILGFSEVLGSIDALDDKQQRYVGNIQRSGKMLLEMINDILDLAKMESGRMRTYLAEFPVEAVVVAQCDMARPLSERKNIDLESVCPKGLPPLRQDQAKLQQILNNLLSNAIKFTPEGGRIMVRVSRELAADQRPSSSRLCLEVEDTGIGISEADQAIIFEKFRQGASAAPQGDVMTREQGGTGLGLSIVRELCRLLGGDVSLESVSGKGSTFRVNLPWELADSENLDEELARGVAELTRPTPASLPAPIETPN